MVSAIVGFTASLWGYYSYSRGSETPICRPGGKADCLAVYSIPQAWILGFHLSSIAPYYYGLTLVLALISTITWWEPGPTDPRNNPMGRPTNGTIPRLPRALHSKSNMHLLHHNAYKHSSHSITNVRRALKSPSNYGSLTSAIPKQASRVNDGLEAPMSL